VNVSPCEEVLGFVEHKKEGKKKEEGEGLGQELTISCGRRRGGRGGGGKREKKKKKGEGRVVCSAHVKRLNRRSIVAASGGGEGKKTGALLKEKIGKKRGKEKKEDRGTAPFNSLPSRKKSEGEKKKGRGKRAPGSGL